MRCPQCGSEAVDKFCAECGAALGTPPCPSCGETAPAGAFFCIFCGTRLRRPPPPSARRRLWAGGVAAGALVAGAVFWALGRNAPPDSSFPLPVGGPIPGAGTPPDLSSMTPREAADRLYDRVMRAASAGDTAEALAFLPMTLDAYALVVPLDADGHYHVSLLHALGGERRMARDAADRALADAPDHLLLLGAAAAAAAELGDEDGADAYYARFLEAWDGERAQGREEYSVHEIPLAEMRRAAEARRGG